MSLSELKTLYEMEKNRVNTRILSILFSLMLAFIIIITLFRPSMSGGITSGSPLLSMSLAFMYFFTVFFGITFSILVMQEIKSDFTRGVYYTIMTYPVKPGEFLMAKVLAIWSSVLIDIILTFSIFAVISLAFLIYGMLIFALIISLFLLLTITMLTTLILSPIADLSPLPEMIIIGIFLGITLFSYSLPSEYLALVAPYFTIIKIAGGAKVSVKEITFAAFSPFIYMVLAYLSYTFVNVRKRSVIK